MQIRTKRAGDRMGKWWVDFSTKEMDTWAGAHGYCSQEFFMVDTHIPTGGGYETCVWMALPDQQAFGPQKYALCYTVNTELDYNSGEPGGRDWLVTFRLWEKRVSGESTRMDVTYTVRAKSLAARRKTDIIKKFLRRAIRDGHLAFFAAV